MKRTMNAAITTRDSVRHFPGLQTLADVSKRRSWLYRAAVWSGVIMATPEHPKGWQLNPATVTLSLVIAGMIATGSYYVGGRDAEMRMLQEKIQKAADDAAKAKQLETYNAGSVDAMKGHANANTEKKK